jgi:hypothetical protein
MLGSGYDAYVPNEEFYADRLQTAEDIKHNKSLEPDTLLEHRPHSLEEHLGRLDRLVELHDVRVAAVPHETNNCDGPMSYSAARNAAADAARSHLTAPGSTASYASIRTGGDWGRLRRLRTPTCLCGSPSRSPARSAARRPSACASAGQEEGERPRQAAPAPVPGDGQVPTEGPAEHPRSPGRAPAGQQNNREIRAAYQARRAGR